MQNLFFLIKTKKFQLTLFCLSLFLMFLDFLEEMFTLKN